MSRRELRGGSRGRNQGTPEQSGRGAQQTAEHYRGNPAWVKGSSAERWWQRKHLHVEVTKPLAGFGRSSSLKRQPLPWVTALWGGSFWQQPPPIKPGSVLALALNHFLSSSPPHSCLCAHVQSTPFLARGPTAFSLFSWHSSAHLNPCPPHCRFWETGLLRR